MSLPLAGPELIVLTCKDDVMSLVCSTTRDCTNLHSLLLAPNTRRINAPARGNAWSRAVPTCRDHVPILFALPQGSCTIASTALYLHPTRDKKLNAPARGIETCNDHVPSCSAWSRCVQQRYSVCPLAFHTLTLCKVLHLLANCELFSCS